MIFKEILLNYDLSLGDSYADPRDFCFYSLVLLNRDLETQMSMRGCLDSIDDTA